MDVRIPYIPYDIITTLSMLHMYKKTTMALLKHVCLTKGYLFLSLPCPYPEAHVASHWS
jgi:hypothetical protein